MMMESPRLEQRRITLRWVRATSRGARDYQEDANDVWHDELQGCLLAVVADGAGGHGGGSDASTAAVSAAESAWSDQRDRGMADPEEFLTAWMEMAHAAVNAAAARIHRSARAVVVACFTDGVSAHWVHAGDSRLLRFRDGKLVERTRDDSVVQVLFERGDITEEDMGTHPDQSRLLQSLGGEDPPTPRLGETDLEPGDVLILCSDGFWEHLGKAELETLAATPPDKRQGALDEAIETAVNRGGSKADNTTAIMIHCEGMHHSAAPNHSTTLATLLMIALGAALGWWAFSMSQTKEESPHDENAESHQRPASGARPIHTDVSGPDTLDSTQHPPPLRPLPPTGSPTLPGHQKVPEPLPYPVPTPRKRRIDPLPESIEPPIR